MLEESRLADRFDTSAAYDAPVNEEAAGAVLPIYLCPSTVTLADDRDEYRTLSGRGAIDYGGMFGSQEVAKRMNRSRQAVRQMLWRALLKLKAAFGDTESLHLPQRSLKEDGSSDA